MVPLLFSGLRSPFRAFQLVLKLVRGPAVASPFAFSNTSFGLAATGSWRLRGTCLEPVWPVLRRWKNTESVPSLSLPPALELLRWKFLQSIKIWTCRPTRGPGSVRLQTLQQAGLSGFPQQHMFKGSCKSIPAGFHNSSLNTLPIPVFPAFEGMQDTRILRSLSIKLSFAMTTKMLLVSAMFVFSSTPV